MHVAENFSAKRWVDNLISIAEGHHTEKAATAEEKVETVKVVAPASNNSMGIDNSFRAQSWVHAMLAKARFAGTEMS